MKTVNQIIAFVLVMCFSLTAITANADFPASSLTQADYPVSKTEDFEYSSL